MYENPDVCVCVCVGGGHGPLSSLPTPMYMNGHGIQSASRSSRASL